MHGCFKVGNVPCHIISCFILHFSCVKSMSLSCSWPFPSVILPYVSGHYRLFSFFLSFFILPNLIVMLLGKYFFFWSDILSALNTNTTFILTPRIMIRLFKVKEKQNAENANGRALVKKQSAGELRLHKGNLSIFFSLFLIYFSFEVQFLLHGMSFWFYIFLWKIFFFLYMFLLDCLCWVVMDRYFLLPKK